MFKYKLLNEVVPKSVNCGLIKKYRYSVITRQVELNLWND